MKVFIQLDEEGFIDGWGSSTISDDDIEMDLEDDHPFFISPGRFIYRNGNLVKDDTKALKEAKEDKDKELNKLCQKEIENGFDQEFGGEVYHFSLDQEAQLNFQGVIMMMSQGILDGKKWTVSQNGKHKRIMLDKSMLTVLIGSIENHKSRNVSRYRDYLMEKVEQSETIEEVNSIQWDDAFDEYPEKPYPDTRK